MLNKGLRGATDVAIVLVLVDNWLKTCVWLAAISATFQLDWGLVSFHR